MGCPQHFILSTQVKLHIVPTVRTTWHITKREEPVRMKPKDIALRCRQWRAIRYDARLHTPMPKCAGIRSRDEWRDVVARVRTKSFASGLTSIKV
mgnify:CR=1 FL=1|jgi:hypothetical protein